MDKEILEVLKNIDRKLGNIENKLNRLEQGNLGPYFKNETDQLHENESVRQVLDFFQEKMGSISFDTWIKPTVGNSYLRDNILIIPCENLFIKDILESKYLDSIKEVCIYDIDLVVEKNGARAPL